MTPTAQFNKQAKDDATVRTLWKRSSEMVSAHL
jgi:hypothetical protein